MRTITLVTGNESKLYEYQSLLPEDTDITFVTHKLDLTEIQSLDPEEIVRDKLVRAYDAIGQPVIVEDVAAGIDKLHGLPGPFFKFFEQKLGQQALLSMARPGESLTITCTSGYFDGTEIIFGTGVLRGMLSEPRGDNGFGFDPTVIPEGESRTMAEMTTDEKNEISHRAKAIKDLLQKLPTDD